MRMGSRAWLGVLLLLAPGPAHAAPPSTATPASPLVFDTAVHFDANELSVAISNFGTIARDYHGELGLEWPQGSGRRLIHGAGLWLLSFKPGIVEVHRSAMADYGSEYTPGQITGSGGATDEAGTNPTYYVYKISRADLTTPGRDYVNWPISQSAPVDSLGNPLLIGDQTLYCTFNDASAGYHSLPDGSANPLGAEVHETVFGTSRQASLARVMFVHYLVMNRSISRWPEFYAGIWVDPDIGYPYDDLAGADTAYRAAYAYDSEGPPGVEPNPAVGVCVLLDSLMNRVNYQPIRSISAWTVNEDPESYSASLNLVRGLQSSGDPWLCPADSSATRFPFYGDPVAGTGCLDPIPGDKRLLISTGPFDVNPGATVDLVVAFVVGAKAGATSIKDNVADLEDGFAAAHEAWRDMFSQVLPVPTQPGLSAAFPNPSQGVSYFDFAIPLGVTAHEIQVYDMRGRLLWKEPAALARDGYFRLQWKGQTLAGTPAPPGIYFFKLLTDRGPFIQKAVRLR